MQNGAEKGTIGPKNYTARRGWRKLHDEELHG
jgi:hypothetical protein